jgi:hypothetical protein
VCRESEQSQYDHLFDAGYSSFDDDGRLLESPVIASISPAGDAQSARGRVLQHKVAIDHKELRTAEVATSAAQLRLRIRIVIDRATLAARSLAQ